MLDIENLTEKAKAASDSRPGEWHYGLNVAELSTGDALIAEVLDDACGHFFAAATPSAVLSLIYRLKRMEQASEPSRVAELETEIARLKQEKRYAENAAAELESTVIGLREHLDLAHGTTESRDRNIETIQAHARQLEAERDEAHADVERLHGWLAMIIKLYEDASPCYDEPDGEGCFMGYAVHIDDEPFKAICDWLNDRANEKEGRS